MLCYFWVYRKVIRLLLFSRLAMSDSFTPWTVARWAPLSMRFPRQEYLSGLPFPSPGDLVFLKFFRIWTLGSKYLCFLCPGYLFPQIHENSAIHECFHLPSSYSKIFFSLEEIPKLCLTMCLQNDISLKIQHYEHGPIPSLQTNK